MAEERDPALDVRRPDLLGVRREGTVRWWKEDAGYGRITADDGEILFAHFSGIEGSGFRSLEEGQRVSFVWDGGIQDHGRRRAEGVRPLDDEAMSGRRDVRHPAVPA
jgi:cold shock CspA family protein